MSVHLEFTFQMSNGPSQKNTRDMAPGIQDTPADQPMYTKPRHPYQLRVGLAIW